MSFGLKKTKAHELIILVEGEEDKKFYDWLLAEEKKKSFKVGIDIESCGGIGCQKAIAGKVVDEKGVPIKAELNFLKTTIPPIDTGKSGKFIKVLPVGVYQILVKSKGSVLPIVCIIKPMFCALASCC
jgi:hypothetical protein